jgi:putative flavoprotein involved in K+ transport
VQSVRRNNGHYVVGTQSGSWKCRAVVVASGACNVPVVPPAAAEIPSGIRTLTPHQYKGPDDLEHGGVLVVGASATGLQLADEIHRSGRPVTLAAGEHVRMPRTYRGRDIQFWLDAAGILDERYDEIDDIVRARRLPSPQLAGSPSPRVLDLNSLTDLGAKLVGRLMRFRGDTALFSGSLRNVCALADLKLGRMLDTIDEWAKVQGRATEYPEPERFAATRIDDSPQLTLNVPDGNIRTIIWATGFRPDYSWLDVPVLDQKGNIRHDGGVADADGLYVTGLPILRRRKSSFIHGAEDDARELTEHIAGYLDERSLPQ